MTCNLRFAHDIVSKFGRNVQNRNKLKVKKLQTNSTKGF